MYYLGAYERRDFVSNLNEVKALHPCFGSAKNKGRIHLPVCPNCNIQCNFCDRKIHDTENRPGVTRSILTPTEALEVVDKSIQLCPDITVVGIAGPGDTLASNKALQTFTLIKEKHPKLLKCMSTNGLLLNERADELIELGIDTLTVTVNGVDKNIVSKIVSKIIYHQKVYVGESAAEILIENQIAGIEKMARAGVTIKVNSVLIKEINEEHIKEIARTVGSVGASIYNIIPLIPRHKLAHCKEPTCKEIDGARRIAGEYIDVFRHCMRCRADAIGLLGGKDISSQIYREKLDVVETFSHG